MSLFLGVWNCRAGSRQQGGFPLGCLRSWPARLKWCGTFEYVDESCSTPFYQHDLDHAASWIHCRWGTPGVLDHAIIRLECQRFVIDVRAVAGAENFSDYRRMVISLWASPGGSQSSFSFTSSSHPGVTLGRHGFVSPDFVTLMLLQSSLKQLVQLRQPLTV